VLVLGIDPGTRVTGYGAVDRHGGRFRCVTHGVVKPPARAGLGERLVVLHDALDELVRRVAPDVVAVEDCFYAKDARAMLKLGQVKGLVLLVAARAGIEVCEYPPRRVKQSVVGNGNATKEQVRFMVERIVAGVAQVAGERRLPLDLTDAVAVAVCHHHTAPLARAGLGAR
jgi:crossover junction endodeoxyribonuclease RuvC